MTAQFLLPISLKFGKQIGVKILYDCIAFLKIFNLIFKNFLYKKCLLLQNYINHLKKAISELLGTKSQRKLTLKVKIFFDNTSQEL